MSGKRKILYIFDAGDAASRLPVAKLARASGYEVILALIGDKQILEAADFETVRISAPEGRINAASLLQMVHEIRKCIAREKPAILHAVTLKYAFIAGLAALPYRHMRKIYTLAGLGYLFRDEDAKAKLLRALTAPFLKFILKQKNTILIFQNPDDRALMIAQGYATDAQSVLIRGSGVDLGRFKPSADSSAEGEKPLVLMPTRLVREKGIHVFIEATRILKSQGIDAEFQIAGGITKHNPKALSAAEMDALTADGAVRWLGQVADMPGLLRGASLVVYPSYYGEGIPRVLLEACAAGRAIITTDHPGCREAVIHGENGLLVPVKNAQATAEAIRALLEDTEMSRRMGQASRALAEKYFDINIIAFETLRVYEGKAGG